MRVAIDLGPVQSDLPPELTSRLARLVEAGGVSVDFRVALDGSDPESEQTARAALVPEFSESAFSSYTIPPSVSDVDSAGADASRELRRSHLGSLQPDVVLLLEGNDAAMVPAGAGYVPLGSDELEPIDTLLEAIRAAVPDQPPLPDPESALHALGIATSDSTALSTGIAADALIRSARVGQQAGEPRLLIDVSNISIFDHRTGIQRVVRRISENLQSIQRGRRHGSTSLLAFGEHDTQVPDARLSETIGGPKTGTLLCHTGDTLLMLDAHWSNYPHLLPRFQDVRRHGGRVMTVIYDIVPLRHPEVTADGISDLFEVWFRCAVAWSDGLICISKAVADDIIAYIDEHDLPYRDGLRVGWWHLGADLPREPNDMLTPEVAEFLEANTPVFLMVGTVEPRKRHVVALEAMERLWSQGHNARLLILGREGWNVSELAARLRNHVEAGQLLLWRDAASDADLAHAYSAATALLFPSHSEGFGLPIVEAARAGLGAIVSDIPVLREVGGDGVVHVPVDDPEALSVAIVDVLDGRMPDPGTTLALSWEESAQHLLEILDKDRWHAVLRKRRSIPTI